MLAIGPAPVLALLVGVFHTALYATLRAPRPTQLLLVLPAAVLGAYAGQAIGLHLGDPIRIGDFGLLSSSVVAWIGIAVVAVMSALGPTRTRT